MKMYKSQWGVTGKLLIPAYYLNYRPTKGRTECEVGNRYDVIAVFLLLGENLIIYL